MFTFIAFNKFHNVQLSILPSAFLLIMMYLDSIAFIIPAKTYVTSCIF